MPVISVIYKSAPDSHFDLDYYLHKHIPMVKTLWEPEGLEKLELFRGAQGLDGGEAPYAMLALLTFGSLDAFERAFRMHGDAVIGDIPNFTDIKGVVQINERAD